MITWNEKLEYLKKETALSIIEFYFTSFQFFDPASKFDINGAMKSYHLLPSNFDDFLAITDGAYIGTFNIFGVGGKYVTIDEVVNVWSENYPVDQFLPIAEDAGGNPFLVGEDGSIYLGTVDPPGEIPVFICDDFDCLLSQIILGDGYRKYFNCSRDNEFCRFLLDRGWAEF